jgi:hypothetical protein
MTRDQFITEKILKRCWHERQANLWEGCKKCGKTATDLPWGDGRYISPEHLNPNYSTSPADILELQRFVMGAEWRKHFLSWSGAKYIHDLYGKEKIIGKRFRHDEFIAWLFSDASRFADLVAEFKGWKP